MLLTTSHVPVVSFDTDGAGCSCLSAFGDSNLVDPASSHMLVSKIKPCMSKYKFFTAKL